MNGKGSEEEMKTTSRRTRQTDFTLQRISIHENLTNKISCLSSGNYEVDRARLRAFLTPQEYYCI